MKNGQDAADLPRKKRGRPPGPRKVHSTSESGGSERQEELLLATSRVNEHIRSSSEIGVASLNMNENNGEHSGYESTQEKQTEFSSFLHTILRRDRAEITRVARAMDVAENTIYRWMNGTSEPRATHLKKLPDVLSEYRVNLSYVINRTFPGILDAKAPGVHEVSKDIYRLVLDLVAIISEEDTRFWQVSQTVFEHALLHLDVERQGLAITFARLMPAHEDGIHSLRESAVRGNAPWSSDIESKAYLGSTTLAGAAVTMQRMLVWNSIGGGDRLQVEVDDYEASACAAPIMRGGRIAGALIVSSTQPMFFNDPMACQAVVEYAQLLATALAEQDFQLHTLLNLRPMPQLQTQRSLIARSYVSRILTYARKYNISRSEADVRVRKEMEQEFEELAHTQSEKQQIQNGQGLSHEKKYKIPLSGQS